jgi:hypothetical protein
MRMEESNPTKKVLFTKPLENEHRKRGSSKLRWHEMLEEDGLSSEFGGLMLSCALGPVHMI